MPLCVKSPLQLFPVWMSHHCRARSLGWLQIDHQAHVRIHWNGELVFPLPHTPDQLVSLFDRRRVLWKSFVIILFLYFVYVCNFLYLFPHTFGGEMHKKFQWKCMISMEIVYSFYYDIYSGASVFESSKVSHIQHTCVCVGFTWYLLSLSDIIHWITRF